MPSSFPSTPDDLGRDNLTHGDVSDALAAVETAVAGLLAAAPSTSAQFLSGPGAPAAGSGLDPLDGTSDPWRWSSVFGGWVGPAYEVTWEADETITGPADVAGEVYLITGPGLPTGPDVLYLANTTFSSGTGAYDAFAATTTTAGSGVLFAVQYEPGFTHTSVPNTALDVTALTTVAVGAAYTFPEGTIGNIGDTYRDISAPANQLVLYGPKTASGWGTAQTFTSA